MWDFIGYLMRGVKGKKKLRITLRFQAYVTSWTVTQVAKHPVETKKDWLSGRSQ